MAELVPPLADLLPKAIGPYMTLMVAGFGVGIFGHLVRSRLLIAIGILMIFLATLVFPLALVLTNEKPPEVLDYPSRER